LQMGPDHSEADGEECDDSDDDETDDVGCALIPDGLQDKLRYSASSLPTNADHLKLFESTSTDSYSREARAHSSESHNCSQTDQTLRSRIDSHCRIEVLPPIEPLPRIIFEGDLNETANFNDENASESLLSLGRVFNLDDSDDEGQDDENSRVERAIIAKYIKTTS